MRLRVEYNVTMVQHIDWPDDELDLLTHENLECNLDIDDSVRLGYEDIVRVTSDGKDFWL